MQPKERKRTRKRAGIEPSPFALQATALTTGSFEIARLRDSTHHRKRQKWGNDFKVISFRSKLWSSTSTPIQIQSRFCRRVVDDVVIVGIVDDVVNIGATLRGKKGSKGGWSCSRRLAASRLLWHLIPSEEKKITSRAFLKKNRYPWNIPWVSSAMGNK